MSRSSICASMTMRTRPSASSRRGPPRDHRRRCGRQDVLRARDRTASVRIRTARRPGQQCRRAASRQGYRDITEEQLKRTFQTNIFGMFFMTQAAIPHLKPGAAIVNCTSITMYQGSKELLDYSEHQGRDHRLHPQPLRESDREGHPRERRRAGPDLDAAQSVRRREPEKLKTFGEKTPMGRPGQPNEVAPAFLFLACEDASYMSGQVLHPNGGTGRQRLVARSPPPDRGEDYWALTANRRASVERKRDSSVPISCAARVNFTPAGLIALLSLNTSKWRCGPVDRPVEPT
jgi:hypothetical protein